MSATRGRRWAVAAAFLVGVALFLLVYKWGWIAFVHPSTSRYPIRGIDVSHHQGQIAWEDVAKDGMRFAWLKATEGADWTDPTYIANRDGAAAAGLDWGPYHFFGFCSPPEAQAAHFLAVIGSNPGRLPPAIDVERGGNCAKQPSPTALRADLGTFLGLIEPALGREAVIYLMPGQVGPLFGAAGPPDRPLWVRDLFHEPPAIGGRAWTIWQHHARGWVWGVHAAVDLNVFSGDEAAYRRWLARP